LVTEALNPQYSPCLAYFTGFAPWQARALLFNRMIGRFSAILINLLTYVYIRFVMRHVRITPHATVTEMRRMGVDGGGAVEEAPRIGDDGVARYFLETQMQMRDYVKILILIDTFFGLPYSIVVEISSIFASDDYSKMLLMAVTVFCTTLSGVIDPALFIVKNKYVRKRIYSVFARRPTNFRD
uniref:G protein-coupled receptor n=1 Tax=Romanomermis culicivorax TaxID=13658 RepID=A0A915JCY1_ROMCU